MEFILFRQEVPKMTGLVMAAVICAGMVVMSDAYAASTGSAESEATRVYRVASPYVLTVHARRDDGSQLQGSAVVLKQFNATTTLVVTNAHVVRGARAVVISTELSSWPATVWRIFESPDIDIAFLQIPVSLPGPKVRDSDLPLGADVYAIGSPRGLERSLSRGIVSGKRLSAIGVGLIQTDAAISPGSSGGGLFDGQGHWVGVTTFKLQESSGTRTESLNFAVDATDIVNLVWMVRDAKNFAEVLNASDAVLYQRLSESLEGDLFPLWLAAVNRNTKDQLSKVLEAGVVAIGSNPGRTSATKDAAESFFATTRRLVIRIAEDWKSSPEFATDTAVRRSGTGHVEQRTPDSNKATSGLLRFICEGDPPGIASYVQGFRSLIDSAMSQGRIEQAAELRHQYDAMVQSDVRAGRRTAITVEAGSLRVISPAGWTIVSTSPDVRFQRSSSEEFIFGDDWIWRTEIGPGGRCVSE